MASDKLMNHTQGETIITKLTAIADSLDDLAAVTPAKLGMGIATCDTPGSTAAKTAALANFALVEGAPVSVQFLYANTADNATLNINNTGAKPIIYKDAAIGNDVISAGDTCTFIYTTNTYKITNIDTLTGPGSGTVRQVGAENGLITDQSDNADIQTTGKIGLNLKSDTAFSTEAPDPVEIEDKLYPVALDAAGHPAVSVPGTEYTQGAGINISENNVITNTGVFDVTAPTSSDTTATNGDIKVIKKVVNDGVTTESVAFVKPKGINDPAFKALDSSTSGLTSDDNHVPTSKTVQDAIDTALASASVYKGTIAAFNDLPTSTATVIVRKGWYYRVSTAWSAATGTPATHVGDIIIAEKDSPSKAIDSANWSLLHNEANTDANVTQSPVSTNANYEVLFSGSADNTSHTEGTGKDSGLTYNPSTNKLTVSGEVSASSYSGLPEGNTTTKGIVQLGTDADKAASGSHGHGNITNGGALQTTDVSIASGDKLVITDASDSNKVARSSVSFDGSTATQALTKKGTFESFQAPISASNKLSSDFVDDTNKTHRFATANQLTQIATNKTNILYALENGVKNLLPDAEDTVTSTRWIDYPISIPAGTYEVYIGAFSSNDTDSTMSQVYFFKGTTTLNTFVGITKKATDMHATITTNDTSTYLRIYASSNATLSTGDSITLSKVMVCKKEVWDASPSYAPHALPNYDLTRLEAKDRAALAEEIDAGAKNKIKYDMAQLAALNPLWIVSGSTIRPSSDTHITFTLNSDMSIRVQSDGSNAQAELCTCSSNYSSFKAGTYVLSGCPTGGNSSTTYDLRLIEQSSPKKYNTDVGLGKEITWSAQYVYTCNIMVRANQNIDITFKPMLCTKAAFGVSSAFVPYKYPSPTSIALQTESFNVVAANTYYKIFEQFVGGDSVNRLYKIAAAAMYAGSRPAALKVTTQSQTAGSTETLAREITSESNINYLSTDYIWRSYGGTIRVYASYKAVTNKGAAYLIIDQYKV